MSPLGARMMRLKFGQRQSDWRCCFCCHVRTGTIILGIWQLLLHILTLSVIAVVLRHPELVLDEGQFAPVLPTPLSEVEEPVQRSSLFSSDLTLRDPSDIPAPSTLYDSRYDHKQVNIRAIVSESLNVGVVVTFCTFLITLLMVFGAVKGKPSYLMPFFCLQVFDFCIASLTAVGYLCYPPNIRHMVERNPHLPFKEQLLEMNVQCLSLLAVFTFMFVMVLKAYFIGVVWGCYKYLSLRQAAQQRTIHFIDPDSQSLLQDLPDYETAVCDPRYLPPSMKKFPPPPPSYATVAAAYPPPPDFSVAVSSDAAATAAAAASGPSAITVPIPTPVPVDDNATSPVTATATATSASPTATTVTLATPSPSPAPAVTAPNSSEC